MGLCRDGERPGKIAGLRRAEQGTRREQKSSIQLREILVGAIVVC